MTWTNILLHNDAVITQPVGRSAGTQGQYLYRQTGSMCIDEKPPTKQTTRQHIAVVGSL